MIIMLIIISIFICTHTKRHCRTENRVLNYYKLKSCHLSTLPVVFWRNVNKVEECIQLARERNGLAFNFSPINARKYIKEFPITCQILGCPEIANSSTLIENIGFDYYSAYGNWTATQNATCIKNVGLFSPILQKQNYIKSIKLCQEIGADLADVTSEIRTKYLSHLINKTFKSWYKVAYVGLDDTEDKGEFITAFGVLLRCATFRSWAPGHPISNTDEHNCVVLDDNRMWRLVDCKRKLPVICEFFSEKPQNNDINMCKDINNTVQKRRCIKEQTSLNEMITNLSRIEQCAILNVETATEDAQMNVK